MKTPKLLSSMLGVFACYIMCSCSSTKTMALNSMQLISQLRPEMSYDDLANRQTINMRYVVMDVSTWEVQNLHMPELLIAGDMNLCVYCT